MITLEEQIIWRDSFGCLAVFVLKVISRFQRPHYSAGRRDCSAGKFLYEKLPDYGIRRVSCAEGSAGHSPYLEKMGFVRTDGVYKKDLTN